MHDEVSELARGGDSDIEEEDQGMDLERLKKQSTGPIHIFALQT